MQQFMSYFFRKYPNTSMWNHTCFTIADDHAISCTRRHRTSYFHILTNTLRFHLSDTNEAPGVEGSPLALSVKRSFHVHITTQRGVSPTLRYYSGAYFRLCHSRTQLRLRWLVVPSGRAIVVLLCTPFYTVDQSWGCPNGNNLTRVCHMANCMLFIHKILCVMR